MMLKYVPTNIKVNSVLIYYISNVTRVVCVKFTLKKPPQFLLLKYILNKYIGFTNNYLCANNYCTGNLTIGKHPTSLYNF